MWLAAWLAAQLPAWLSGSWAYCGPPTSLRTVPSCAGKHGGHLLPPGPRLGELMRLGLGQRSLEPLTSQTVGASLLSLSGLGMSSGPPPTVGGSGWAGGDSRGLRAWGYFCLSTNSPGWLWPLSSRRPAGN